MKIYDYGKWTKIYTHDGYGFASTHSIHSGHLTELQISEICRAYASYELLTNGESKHSWIKLPHTDGYGQSW